MKVQIEEVTPERAREWLALSRGNRRLNENFVLSLAVAMGQGAWVPEASEVVFDDSGALIDGHHRLSAVDVHGQTVKMAVKRGVPAAARNVIDTGRTRSVVDLLSMYRDVKHLTHRRSALTACVGLLTGVTGGTKRVTIRTLDAFDAWYKHFREGVDWVISATLSADVPSASRRAFGIGPVLGAFAFAHKLNPANVEKFHRTAIMGERLEAGQPAYTLRNFILVPYNGHNRMGMAATARRDVALKVLAAIQAELQGQRLGKLLVNSYSLPFFRAAYKGRTLDKLMEPWESAESHNGAESKE